MKNEKITAGEEEYLCCVNVPLISSTLVIWQGFQGLRSLIAFAPTNNIYVFFCLRLAVGTFVVNIGDVVEAWTQGQFRATVHRVKNSASKHRISAPFFFQPRLDCVIKPLDGVIATGGAGKDRRSKLALHKPFKFGEYVKNKFEKSYGDN